MESLNSQYQSYEEQLKRELDEARVEADEMGDVIKMKDRMLDDQNVTISNMKQVMKQKEEEIGTLGEAKAKYRGFYEDKLQQAYDEADRSKQRSEDLEARV